MDYLHIVPEYAIGIGFALKHLQIGVPQDNPFDGGQTQISLRSLWYCKLVSALHNTRLLEDMVFGVVNTSKWRKGIIVLPSQIPKETLSAYSQDMPSSPLPTANLDDWQDPVAKALKGVNLFHEQSMVSFDGYGGYEYDFSFATTGYRGSLYVAGRIRYGNLQNVWWALVESVKYFANFYENETIRGAAAKVGTLGWI
jgi:hypothetical protein